MPRVEWLCGQRLTKKGSFVSSARDFLVWFWNFVLVFIWFWFLICFWVWILNLVLYFSSDTFITLVSFNTWDHLFHFGLFGHFERKKKVSVTQEINLSPLPSESLVHRVLREVLHLLAVNSHWMIFYPEWVFIHLLFISSLNDSLENNN